MTGLDSPAIQAQAQNADSTELASRQCRRTQAPHGRAWQVVAKQASRYRSVGYAAAQVATSNGPSCRWRATSLMRCQLFLDHITYRIGGLGAGLCTLGRGAHQYRLGEKPLRCRSGGFQFDLPNITDGKAPGATVDSCTVHVRRFRRSLMPNPGVESSHSKWSVLPAGSFSAATDVFVNLIGKPVRSSFGKQNADGAEVGKRWGETILMLPSVSW